MIFHSHKWRFSMFKNVLPIKKNLWQTVAISEYLQGKMPNNICQTTPFKLNIRKHVRKNARKHAT